MSLIKSLLTAGYRHLGLSLRSFDSSFPSAVKLLYKEFYKYFYSFVHEKMKQQNSKRAPTLTQSALICIGGLPGAGKTTCGLSLLEFYGDHAILVDPDQTRLEVLGRPLDDTITDADLTADIHLLTVTRMLEKTREGIRQGKVVIVASAFVRGDMRRDFEKIAIVEKIPFYGFWLSGPTKLNLSRLNERQKKREMGIRDITTISAVSPKNIDPMIITGRMNWTEINMTQAPGKVFMSMLEYIPIDDMLRPMTQIQAQLRNAL